MKKHKQIADIMCSKYINVLEAVCSKWPIMTPLSNELRALFSYENTNPKLFQKIYKKLKEPYEEI